MVLSSSLSLRDQPLTTILCAEYMQRKKWRFFKKYENFTNYYLEIRHSLPLKPLYHLSLNQSETFTSEIRTGTSTNGPITVANATGDAIPKTAMATAIASSKLLEAAVNEREADFW